MISDKVLCGGMRHFCDSSSFPYQNIILSFQIPGTKVKVTIVEGRDKTSLALNLCWFHITGTSGIILKNIHTIIFTVMKQNEDAPTTARVIIAAGSQRSHALKVSFLAPLAVGQRAYVMVRCPSCVRPCVNFFCKHLLR